MQARSQQTITIEEMLRSGQSQMSIAREMGITRQRVGQIAQRLTSCAQGLAGGGCGDTPLLQSNSMKALTISFTPAVYDALVEACQIANRRDPEEQITIQDYVEQCTINQLVELGLMRKHARRK